MERNIYWEYKMVSAEATVKSGAKKQKTKVRKKIYGINTSGGQEGTRNVMINDILFSIVNNEHEIIKSKYIFDDIKGLQRKKTGKIEHGETSKDDNLFSFLLAHYVLRYGTNLKQYIVNLDKIDDRSISKARKKLLNIFQVQRLVEDSRKGDLSAQMILKMDKEEEKESLKESNISKKLLNLIRQGNN